MAKVSPKATSSQVSESDQVFDLAAELFRVMSAPLRLKIISSLCDGEKNVSELLGADLLPHRQPARGHAVPRGLHTDCGGGGFAAGLMVQSVSSPHPIFITSYI
jgi:hypothetical protein